MWNNNLTHGGHLFVARWTERGDGSDQDPDETSEWVEEGTLAEGSADTGSTAAGFSSNGTQVAGFGLTENNASVMDLGSGRYEISTSTEAGDRWLEIGVLEPGGLWGTYYEDGGLGNHGKTRLIFVIA